MMGSRRISARSRSSIFRCRRRVRVRPRPPPRRRSSDVRSNAQPISGRLYVIVLDDLNVAPLRTKVVINAARELIEKHFAPNDMAAITYTSGRTDGAQEFTSDRAALLAAIDKFQGRRLRSTVIEKADYYFQQTLKEMEDKSVRRSRLDGSPAVGDDSRAERVFGHHDRSRRLRTRPPRPASVERPGEACQRHGRHPRTA